MRRNRPPMALPSGSRRRRRRWGWLGLSLYAVATIVAAIFGYRTARAAALSWAITPLEPVALAQDAPAQAETGDSAPGADAMTSTASESNLEEIGEWVNPERVTVLLMGIDQRQGEDGPWRTDTMIVFSMDPVKNTAFMLSLPRDLWVYIPGSDYGRINTANYIGDLYDLPGGGPALAMETVQNLLGIPVDYYALINFDVFLTVIAAIEPVEVCVSEVIHDDHYPTADYGTEAFHVDPGCQDMDAETLLKYARTRATFGGDFDRARRQQQVISAVRARVLSLGGVSALVGQAGALWEAVQEDVRTNMTLEEIIRLALKAQQIPDSDITFAVIDANYVTFATTEEDEQQVSIPDPYLVRQLMRQLLNPAVASATGQEMEEMAAAAQNEGASVYIENGAGVEGLAGRTQEYLAAQGLNVIGVANADNPDYTQTIIYDYGRGPQTARYIAHLLGLPPSAIQTQPDSESPYDIRLILGADYTPPAQ